MGGPPRDQYKRRQVYAQQNEAGSNAAYNSNKTYNCGGPQNYAPNTVVPQNYYNGSGQPNLPPSLFNSYSYPGSRSDTGSSVSSRFTPAGSITGHDGTKDARQLPVDPGTIRNLDLSLRMWYTARGDAGVHGDLPLRPKDMNKLGKEVSIGLNTYHVLQFPTKAVYQYDITIQGDSADKRMVIAKVWNSKAVKAKLDPSWIFDGNKLAWSATKTPGEIRVDVDLSAERGGRPSERNRFTVYIKPAKVVKFDLLSGYLSGKTSFTPEMLESISFLDHLMRENPSRQFTQIKKSFFSRGQSRFALGNGIEAFKGVFASMRIVHTLNGAALSVNVDVANGTFFTAMPLPDLVRELCRARNNPDLYNMFGQAKGNWRASPMCRFLKCLTHVTVYKRHMPAKNGELAPEFKIHRFMNKDPYEVKFTATDTNGVKREISIAQYFMEKYNHRCVKNLPVVELTKKGDKVPIEMLIIPENQRYRMKLDEKQTSNMIKFAVTLPAQRWEHIQAGVKMLDWSADPYLNNYGLKISPTRAEVKGRVLPTPEPTFANGKIDARTASQGRWRIDGKKFITPNPQPLKSWGVGVINYGRGPCASQQGTSQFFVQFKKIFETHGCKIANLPHVMLLNTSRGGEMITDLWNGTGNKFTAKPQMLFFIVQDRNSEIYNKIKKSCECRYGVVSQVLQSQHVSKCQDQYISNVCMKVNAKLGGATCKAVSNIMPKIDPTFNKVPTMIIGADVSHASPGSEEGSMAALTCSMTTDFTRYASFCQTNGNRVEIINTSIINTQLKKLVEMWMAQPAMRGSVPQRVLYYRDGVSSGQYQHVLEQEVSDMKKLFKAINPQAQPKFTVIICAKRHHIRFFPASGHGDRNGNPNPGTLVETGCTNPFEFDFYLASHSAIKGTARPVHYHCILDECKIGPQVLQQMTFEHCFQYMRSTTPVSMFPAVYYAHLASNRAKAHANKPTISSGKKETHERKEDKKEDQTLSSSDRMSLLEIPPLIPLNNSQGIEQVMWYI